MCSRDPEIPRTSGLGGSLPGIVGRASAFGCLRKKVWLCFWHGFELLSRAFERAPGPHCGHGSWGAGCGRPVLAAAGRGCAGGWPLWPLPAALAGRGRYWAAAASPSHVGGWLRPASAGCGWPGMCWWLALVAAPGCPGWLRPVLAGRSESFTRGASCGWPGMVVAGWGVAGGWPRWPLLAALAMDMAGPGWLHLAPPPPPQRGRYCLFSRSVVLRWPPQK